MGKHNLRVENETGAVTYEVLDIILHKDWKYKEVSYDADISLIVLEIEVDLSRRERVAIVCLPQQSDNEVVGNGTVVGWGISKRSVANLENFDTTLNELLLPVIPQPICLEMEEFYLGSSKRTFCAGFMNQGKSSCKGDSGGGFYQVNRLAGGYILSGIVSASLRDPMLNPCRTDTYNIFTNVGKFVDWIVENIKRTKELKWESVKLDCNYDEDRYVF